MAYIEQNPDILNQVPCAPSGNFDVLLDQVIYDTGGGVYALRTTGGGGGGGDATAANQLDQLAAANTTNTILSNVSSNSDDIKTTSLDTSVSTAEIKNNTDTANVFLGNIDTSTAGIKTDTAYISARELEVSNNTLSTANNTSAIATYTSNTNNAVRNLCAFRVNQYNWNAGATVTIPGAALVIGAFDPATGIAFTMTQLGVLTGGVNAAVVYPGEMAYFTGILKDSELFNKTEFNTTTNRNWKNNTATNVILLTVANVM
jgi:hypothetical protein